MQKPRTQIPVSVMRVTYAVTFGCCSAFWLQLQKQELTKWQQQNWSEQSDRSGRRAIRRTCQDKAVRREREII